MSIQSTEWSLRLGKCCIGASPFPSSCFDLRSAFSSRSAPLQVIHQLKQLGTVWQDVLPVSIYCKAMGNLLNTAITEVTAKIMMLEVCVTNKSDLTLNLQNILNFYFFVCSQ